MKVHLHIEGQLQETEIHIYTAQYDEAIEQLMKKINTTSKDTIAGYLNSDIHLLKLEEIFSIYTEDTKVYLQTDEEEFECKSKLYELEERLGHQFVRANKSILVNMDKISSIQSKVLSSPVLLLSNGCHVAVSRKYFKLLKEKLGLGRER